jgi:endonuclease/exonuclease/phosphatase (EEP) superfamily protein YafD
VLDEADTGHQPAKPEGGPRRGKRRWTGATECKLGVLAGLAGLFLSRLGQLWIGFDVFSQFTLHFALITLAFLIGWMMPRAKLFTALVLLLAGILAIGIWPHVASRAPQVLAQAEAGERALTVASFNTLWVNANTGAMKAEIERIDADIVTLIEVSPAKKPVLAELKSRYPHQVNCFAIDYCKLAILSKLPILKSEARAGWEGPPFIRARLGPEAGGLNVFGVHTIRFPHSRAQFRQVAAIADLIEAVPGPKLVMGDFNATPFSRILSMVEERASLRRITHLPSWPAQAGLPQIAIDHIFLSPGLRTLEAPRIGEPSGSDHYPIAARIAVPLSR